MKAVESKGWACSNSYCNKLYKFDERGKQWAEACCQCSTKGCKGFVEYTGMPNLKCKKCRLEERIPDLEKYIEKSVQELRSAKEELERYNKSNI